MSMLTEAQRKWIDALRSGRFTQCRNALRDPTKDSFCCLGVANEISGLGVWDAGCFQDATLARATYHVDDETPISGYEEEFTSPAVQKWLGLRTKDGAIDGGITLAELNDAGRSFAEIADIIEAKASRLFVEFTQPPVG